MTEQEHIDIIAVGGSAGSLPVLVSAIQALPQRLSVPVLIVVHRLKNVDSTLKSMLSPREWVREPDDKEKLKGGVIYLAPQNYHLLVEEDGTVSLDTSELVNYSRPSIDVTFMSVASVYGNKALAILLSGANKDGVAGLDRIVKCGGRAIVQDPATAISATMPQSAVENVAGVEVQTPEKIVNTILNINR
jgi:two-component system, chemotaxis family, protein-glutamate methylesterase/glutaminase